VSASRNDDDGFTAEGDAAVELLTSTLAVHRYRPSTFLAALFHQAGRTPLVKDLRWISTERILYATRPIAERMPSVTIATSAEGRAIRAVARLLQRNPERFDLLFADPVDSPDSPDRGASADAPIRRCGTFRPDQRRAGAADCTRRNQELDCTRRLSLPWRLN
jgi:hypothetical protein